MKDRNFDDLAEKFSQNIYGTAKGQIRQAILRDELDEILPTLPAGPLSIVDAGGGMGQISSGLAASGHHVLLGDVSGKMLERAEENAQRLGVSGNMVFKQMRVQDIADHLDKPADLVLFHAVLEWVAEPETALKAIYDVLTPGGVLSLMFYNQNGLVMQNLTLGNFGYLRADMKKRKKRTLSPDYPRDPVQVYHWLTECGFIIEQRAGIRVFSDFIRDMPPSANGFDGILEMERRFSRQEPFLSLGRYIHVTARKPLQKDQL
ncbi:putative chromosome partitioning mechanism S-adenosylmethionine-dependent methyltransferase [Tatumella ptyseos ATCC 33301]|uniref:tRNA 5-carboxymethoxyuridine methyltransferase n=1 Tax=Tatumella ptyseos ATCC 33301 TaxID=1005995 RepID=A0A085JCC5_9GAMM|nr:tRNA uridine 5-oxyacetic acid(34) methyltransferase CmoM [Tatumella ptyseos]KFD18121.1 putative chromosome partitioning mechanism S-adenosylmethionine-dependent methyltransferase [Tatumella ptyseos ATCC 33301]